MFGNPSPRKGMMSMNPRSSYIQKYLKPEYNIPDITSWKAEENSETSFAPTFVCGMARPILLEMHIIYIQQQALAQEGENYSLHQRQSQILE
jgi:hypothetical protein